MPCLQLQSEKTGSPADGWEGGVVQHIHQARKAKQCYFHLKSACTGIYLHQPLCLQYTLPPSALGGAYEAKEDRSQEEGLQHQYYKMQFIGGWEKSPRNLATKTTAPV